MIKIKFIVSKGNSPPQVHTTYKSNKVRLNKDYRNIESNICYDGFLADSNEPIISGDWCIVTNPYDGKEYYEQCKKVSVENNGEIFYGMEGTRCLLIDAVKIVGSTNKSLKGIKHLIIDEEMLTEYNCQHSGFMQKDLLE